MPLSRSHELQSLELNMHNNQYNTSTLNTTIGTATWLVTLVFILGRELDARPRREGGRRQKERTAAVLRHRQADARACIDDRGECWHRLLAQIVGTNCWHRLLARTVGTGCWH